MVKSIKKDNYVTLQFSAGAYITAISPLVKFYKETEGKSFKAGDVDGLSIFITSVITDTDDSGKITGYMIELAVHGEKVKLTLYDTTVKVRVQGGKQQQKYTNRALLPYIDRMIKQNTVNKTLMINYG